MRDKKEYFKNLFNTSEEDRPHKLLKLAMYGQALREGNGVMSDSFVVDVEDIDFAELESRALLLIGDSFPS